MTVDRCSQIERHNRLLLHKMNEILQGSQNKLPTARTSTLGPLVQGPRHSSVKPSLNRRLREKSDLRI